MACIMIDEVAMVLKASRRGRYRNMMGRNSPSDGTIAVCYSANNVLNHVSGMRRQKPD